MGGGLMQLVAYGAQDIYLTGNPQITFWKVVYRRCTNFAIESVEQTFMGNAEAGARASATISRNGDLVSNCILEVSAKQANTGPMSYAGMHHLVESVEVEIISYFLSDMLIFRIIFPKEEKTAMYDS